MFSSCDQKREHHFVERHSVRSDAVPLVSPSWTFLIIELPNLLIENPGHVFRPKSPDTKERVALRYHRRKACSSKPAL
jgi:hypothetical protein